LFAGIGDTDVGDELANLGRASTFGFIKPASLSLTQNTTVWVAFSLDFQTTRHDEDLLIAREMTKLREYHVEHHPATACARLKQIAYVKVRFQRHKFRLQYCASHLR
jgi:hypothetical protein